MSLYDQVAASGTQQDTSQMSPEELQDYLRRQKLGAGSDPEDQTAQAPQDYNIDPNAPDSSLPGTSPTGGSGPVAAGLDQAAAAVSPTSQPTSSAPPAVPAATAAPSTSSTSVTTKTAGTNPHVYLSQPPSDAEVRSVLQTIQDTKRQLAPRADTSGIDQAEAEAKQLYHDKADRAEWMSVAEKIGNAAIKFGQANAAIGKHVDVSQMKDLAPTDWTKYTDRAASDYGTDLGSLEKNRATARQGVQDQQALNNDQYEDQIKGLDRQAGFLQSKFGQESQDYRQNLRDENRDNRFMNMENTKSSNASNRSNDQDARQQKALQVRDLQQQIKEAQGEQNNASTAANLISQQQDLGPKALEKMESQSPGIMGRAGISPTQLADINSRSQKKGLLWDSTDPATRDKLIQDEIVGPKQQKIQTLRDALQHVLGGQAPQGNPSQGAAPQQAAAPQAPAGGSDQVKVRNPNGQVGFIPKAQLQSALDSHYTLVQ